jgi:hypothetical protein
MRTLFTIFMLAGICFSHISAQVSIEWQRTLGGSYFDEPGDIATAPDGTCFMVGVTGSSNHDIFGYHGNFDYFVAKFSSSGAVLWKKPYGGSDYEEPYCVHPLDDGGCIVLGWTSSLNHDVQNSHGGPGDAWMIRLSSSGNILWQRAYGGSGKDELYNISPTADGGYLLTGLTNSTDGDVQANYGGTDFWVVRTDSLGQIMWENSYGGSQDDKAYSGFEASDGSLIVVGESKSDDWQVVSNKGKTDMLVMKLSPEGFVTWSLSFGTSDTDQGNLAGEVPGGYLAGGTSGSIDGDLSGLATHYVDFWLLKLGYDGSVIWQKTFGGSGSDRADEMVVFEDGSCAITGTVSSDDFDFEGNDGNIDIGIIRVSAEGDLLWQKTFGGTKAELAGGIDRTPDNGFVLTGYAWSVDGDLTGIPNKGYNDFWVLKLSPETISAAEEAATDPILLYPNPAADAVTISVPEPFSELQIIITSASGIAVLQKTITNGSALSLTGLPAGVYTLQARMPDGRVRTGKMGKF